MWLFLLPAFQRLAWRACSALFLGCFIVNLAHGQPIDLRGNLLTHDPSTIIKCKDRYYTFHTGPGILSSWSTDKVFWSAGPRVFAEAPNWTTNAVPGFEGVFWAPDVLCISNRYFLYYSVSTWGKQVSAIGLATNPTLDPADPAYQWTDHGIVIQSWEGAPYNTIDPAVTWDADGNLWLVYGSYWTGIYLVQLDPVTGLRVSPDSPAYRLAWNPSIEAACIHRRGGYYYLFVNWGSCCSGVNSSYNVRVGRSTRITGPYFDANGVDMVDRGGNVFMRASGKFAGPGHIGVLAEEGTESFSFHYYDANSWAPHYGAYGTSKLGMAPLHWTSDGWPYHTNEWSAVYNFTHDARDENGRYYGLLKEGAGTQADSQYGRVLDLDGTDDYVWLPPSVANAQTVAAVVKWRGGGKWQRIFDFGLDTSKTFMLTPSGGDSGVLRCDLNPGGDLRVLQWDRPLPTDAWTHVAVTVDGERGVLYVNGTAVATNNSMNRLPLEGAFQTNHLGRSKFIADEYFNGQYARFSVHGRALSAAEIVAPVAQIDEPSDRAAYVPGREIRLRGSASDFMAQPLPPSTMTWSVRHIDGNMTNLAFGPVSGIAETTFTPTATSGVYEVLLNVSDALGREASKAVCIMPGINWASYYPFTTFGQDASNNYHAVFYNGASVQDDLVRGKVLNLSGSGQFARLPAPAATARTLSTWVKWAGGGAWQRVFDFGGNPGSWFYFCPKDGTGTPEVSITSDAPAYNQLVEVSNPFPIDQWVHVAFVADGRQGILYFDGKAVAVNNSLNLLPSDVFGPNAYLGRSQFFVDPYFKGRIDALKLHSAALKPEQIFAPVANITAPLRFSGGSTIHVHGEAFDFSETALPSGALSWTMALHTNDQSAKVLESSGEAASYAVPTSGPLTTNMFYEVKLDAIDSLGFSQTVSTKVLPNVSRIGFETVPAGLDLLVDGQPLIGGTSLDLVSGFQRELSAPSPQSQGGAPFDFVLWSDAGAISHTVVIPSTNTTYTAAFVQPVLRVSLVEGDFLEFSWPAWAQSLQLYSTTSLTPPSWTPETIPAVLEGSFVRVLAPMNGPAKFFRLGNE